MLDQPVAVDGEAGVIPYCIVHTDTNEPAVEQVVFEALAQLPLAAKTVEDLQNQSAQEFLGGDRVTASVGVHGVKVGIHLPERGVEEVAYGAQGMRLRDEVFL